MAEPRRMPEGLIEREAAAIAARYKVSAGEAEAALRHAFAADPELVQRVCERCANEDVTRWRAYRDAVKGCRKRLYYDLRRYYSDPESVDAATDALESVGPGDAESARALLQQLLAGHVSTRERLPYAEEFYSRLFELAGVPASVLDLGCGMHPLSWPWSGAGRAVQRYVAVDSDARAVRAVSAFARLLDPGRLTGLNVSLADRSWHQGGGEFDLTLMLKVVPVLQRLEPDAVAALHWLPARRVCMTGNVEALTRRRNVEARERRVLQRFVEGTGRRIVGELRVGTEFGYVLE